MFKIFCSRHALYPALHGAWVNAVRALLQKTGCFASIAVSLSGICVFGMFILLTYGSHIEWLGMFD